MGTIFIYSLNNVGCLKPPSAPKGWEFVLVQDPSSLPGGAKSDPRIAWDGPGGLNISQSTWLVIVRRHYSPTCDHQIEGFDLVFTPCSDTKPYFYVRRHLNRVHYPFCFINQQGCPLLVLGCDSNQSIGDLSRAIYGPQIGAQAVIKENSVLFSVAPSLTSSSEHWPLEDVQAEDLFELTVTASADQYVGSSVN